MQGRLSKEKGMREQREAQLGVAQRALAAEQEAAAAAAEASANSLQVRKFRQFKLSNFPYNRIRRWRGKPPQAFELPSK